MELLLPAPGTALRAEIDSAIVPARITLRPAMELDGVRMIASLVFDGYGPAILPATAVPGHLRERFAVIPVDGLPRRRVGVAQRRRGLPSAPVRAVIDVLGTRGQRLALHARGHPPLGRARSGLDRDVVVLERSRLAPHGPHARAVPGQRHLLDHLEAVAAVEGHVALLGRLEVGGQPLRGRSASSTAPSAPSRSPLPCASTAVPSVARYQCGSWGCIDSTRFEQAHRRDHVGDDVGQHRTMVMMPASPVSMGLPGRRPDGRAQARSRPDSAR